MKHLCILVFFLFLAPALDGQSPFSKNIDIDGYSDGGNSIHQLDSGYLLTATSLCNNNLSECFTILKTDTEGNVTKQVQYQNFPWWITAGAATGNVGTALNNNTGMYFSGSIQSGSPQYDVFLMKTDEGGDSIWLKTYGTSENETNGTLIFSSDSSLTLLNAAYFPKNRVWVLQVDLQGNAIWETFLGDEYKNAIFQDIIRADNGDVVVSYLTDDESITIVDTFFMTVTRLDPFGNELWTSRFSGYKGPVGGTKSSMLELDNGGFLVTYRRFELTGFYKRPPIMVWLDSVGNVTQQYDFPDFTELIITDLIKTSGGLIVGSGYAYLGPPIYDFGYGGWVFAFTQEGEMLWERFIADLRFPDKFSFFSALEETDDKGFILTGGIDTPSPGHDIWLVKLDSMGCLLPDECNDGLQVLTATKEEAETNFAWLCCMNRSDIASLIFRQLKPLFLV
ncbi:MAG: hypothetical protein H6577_15865 [Lewinellaceae bacterium]|nr:hypothetical protein [Saprospiraceae bacterium]MCB9339605.1 hypothetical protein [Lewinellaceae bacterium]